MNVFQNACKARAAIAAVAGLFGPALLSSQAIDIQFDFTYDTNNFFVGNAQRQSVLNAAAQAFEARLTDNLSAITPNGGNTWTAFFDHPGTGAEQALVDLTIAADVIKVYAGGRDLPGSTLGEGGPGGFSASGTAPFVNTVSMRGQLGAAGPTPTDFGPWGGSITFDTLTSWYFDADITTMESIGSMADFYSVAVHELAHLLGFGTAPSWDTWITGSTFTGPASMTLNGGAVPLSGDLGHWANGTTSDVLSPVFINDQETAMDPSILLGTRKYFTELDFAGLDDVGCQVIPEPATAVFVVAGTAILAVRRRRATAI